MRVRKAGQIDEGLWLLGTEESCVYLLEGHDSSALISAGISYILPVFLAQIERLQIRKEKIQHLVILHSHFDHIGIVPYLKRKWPQLKIYASARGWELLTNPKAPQVMKDYTNMVCSRVIGQVGSLTDFDWEWRSDITGDTVGQGGRIELGGKTIEIHETPGHSSCSVTAYVPQLKVIFPSDAVAIPYRDEYIIAAGSSFVKYKESLNKLEGLDFFMIGADHYGCITDDEASHYIARTREATDNMITTLMQTLNHTGNIEQTASILVKKHFDLRPDYFVAPEILISTYRQMLKQFIPTA